MLGVSFDRLLTASCLTGEAREQAIAELMPPSCSRGARTGPASTRPRRRLLKTLDYLAETESAHGRMRVKVIEPKYPGIHAEMQAATVAKAMPGGGGKLGISKICCLQCYVMLAKGDPRAVRPDTGHPHEHLFTGRRRSCSTIRTCSGGCSTWTRPSRTATRRTSP